MNKKKILIIDDEEDFDYFVKINLEKDGNFEVITATSGKEGLKAAFTQKPDLILLDIMMPHMDGFEVLQKLNNAQPDIRKIPIIMLTASRESRNIFKAKNFRISDYIMKPFSLDRLSVLIAKHIELHQ
ncbi:MAG: response regulator [Omnitrophica bacterium]|nr:response regulator [Candidatus Omnitrophota bacterium]